MGRRNIKNKLIILFGIMIMAAFIFSDSQAVLVRRASMAGFDAGGYFNAGYPLGILDLDTYAAGQCENQMDGKVCSELCPGTVKGEEIIVSEGESVPAEPAIVPPVEKVEVIPAQPEVPSAPKVAAKKASSKTKPAAVAVNPPKMTAGRGVRIGVAGPIAGKTKVVNGQRVCPKKNDHPAKSDRNKPGHIDAECCLDPDETPNANCYYPPEKYGKLIQRYLAGKKNKK
ncbi:MAG: hypothetical protein Q8L10_02445 [Candidatus Moranbacteria bacterium]|nr:hypothetical protein [Candidatus Moranbacteria bacterium]